MYSAGTGGSSGGEVEGDRLLFDSEEGRSLSIKPVLLTSTRWAEVQNRHRRLLKFIHKVPPASLLCPWSRPEKAQWVWTFGVMLPFLEGNCGLLGGLLSRMPVKSRRLEVGAGMGAD